jgi:hypothetical protein
MDEHGYSTYGGNSHLFADEDEGWVFLNFAHPEGDLWAAERLGSEEVRVSYPGYIREFPVDYEDDPNFMGSEELLSFAKEQGWWDGTGDTLDLLDVYGAGDFPAETPVEDYFYPEFFQGARNPLEREEEIKNELAPVSLEDMLAYVRDPRWSTDFAGYGQVAHLRSDAHPKLQTLWTAVTSAVSTPYVPIPIATTEVAPEFRQHRYMTANSASNFLDRGWQFQEATRYATRVFKRLMYLACSHSDEFHIEMTGAIEGFEQELFDQHETVEQAAQEFLENGNNQAAADLITDNVGAWQLDSMQLGSDLTEGIEAEIRKRFGFDAPEGRDLAGETTPPASQAMGELDWESMIHCYHGDLEGDLPREHGSYTKTSLPDSDSKKEVNKQEAKPSQLESVESDSASRFSATSPD